MVLYHSDGTVVRAHEKHLENEAHKFATKKHFTEQIDIADDRDRTAHDVKVTKVRIIVDSQTYYEPYYSMYTCLAGEQLQPCIEKQWESPAVDRRTLMKCSSTAYDFFTFEPNKEELHLPVCYPRKHVEMGEEPAKTYETFKKGLWKPYINTPGLSYVNQPDDQMALIRHNEITNYLIPWLNAMEKALEKDEQPLEKYPMFEMPPTLLEMIHLYNVMLQMGISRYFQQPLIDELIVQMYKTNLKQCHLSTLEMTVGRFYSRGVAILDPVLNHLIGTYPFRSPQDRGDPEPLDEDKDEVLIPLPLEKDHRKNPAREMYLEHRPARKWLEYKEEDPSRKHPYDLDTVLHPPKLEVIGHCIRNWSGVRRSKSTAAAHTGYPLNVGRVKKYYRRRATSPIRKENRPGRIDKVDYSTYRLHNLEKVGRQDDFDYFRKYRPGNAAAPVPWVATASAAAATSAGVATPTPAAGTAGAAAPEFDE